ncbi:hypothetical protein BJV82DRAFT_352897 [Fennellomyces sp. T-0311]|nr:hypothetical protein BJV82DRAFT_352897 [Fennellomyces sp. T-0311]
MRGVCGGVTGCIERGMILNKLKSLHLSHDTCTMAEIILGPHNGLTIKGTRPRRPKTRKRDKKPEPTTQSYALAKPVSHHILELNQSNQWSVEQLPDQNYRITIHSVQDVTDFLKALHVKTNEILLPPQQPSRALAPLPYIRYHSELYAKTMARPMTGYSMAALTTIVSESVFYFMECMNGYYAVRPKTILIPWYVSLDEDDLCEHPLALAIGAYWCRHIMIHHQNNTIKDSRVLDAVQHQLSIMAREKLGECFDVPHIDHLFALCLCNMTATFSIEQKVLFHTIAVRMAMDLGVEPRHNQDNDDQVELKNRLWWYLFQIDHFLHESGAISSSMLTPSSDDHDALSKLVKPAPCSLDDAAEAAGASQWGHVLDLWIARHRLIREIHSYNSEAMMDKVNAVIQEWSARAPALPAAMLEAHMTISMEKCTNHGLLLHRFCPPPPAQSLNSLQRRAILHMVECFTNMICFRRIVLKFKPCQTFPGDLKRSIDVLSMCAKYKDPWIIDRSKFGLMQARDVLENMAELDWHDPICIVMIQDVDAVLSQQEQPRSIKIENNLYSGVMMFDRDLQPRARYYRPARTGEPLDGLTVMENVAQFSSSSSSSSS